MGLERLVPLLISLAQNIGLLVSLAVLYRVTKARTPARGVFSDIVSGIVLGVVCIVGMKTPMHFAPGIIFDGRSIILSVGGLFGGPAPAVVAACLTGWYRWRLGGGGWLMGVSVTAASALLGIAFYYARRRGWRMSAWGALGFGLLVHMVMVGLMVLLPPAARIETFRQLALPILIIYSPATMLVCLLFLDYEKKEDHARRLHMSEERYRTTLFSIGDGVIVTDRKGCVELLNPPAEIMTGWSMTEAAGRPLEYIFHILNEETREAVGNPVARVLQEGLVVGLANHTVLIARDGSERAIADAGAPIRDDRGEITGVVLVFRDQTKQRAAERAAEEARRLAQSIVDTLRESLLILGPDFTVRQANRSFYRVFGDVPENVEGKSLFELHAGRWNRPELKKLLRTILPQNTAFNDFELEMDLLEQGRRVLVLNARRVYREPDRTQLILLAIEDATERKQAEQALRNSERRYRAFINASDDLIFIKDSQFRYAVVNEANARFLERSVEEVIGRTDFELMPEEVAKRCRETDERAMAGEGMLISVERVGDRIYETRKFRVGLEDGQVGIGAVIRDVSDRERTLEQLRNQLAELQRWHAVAVGREERIMELKKEVNTLAQRFGEPPPYD
jgi:PAS domain S-box-containing protein